MDGSSARLVMLAAHLLLSGLVFSVFSLESFEFPKLLLLRATCVLLVAGWAFGRLARPGEGLRALRAQAAGLARDPLAWAGALLLASASLSTVWSVSPRVSFFGSEARRAGLTTLACWLVLFLGTRAAARSAGAPAGLLWAAACSAAGGFAYGLAQVLGADPIAWGEVHWYGGFARPGSTTGNPNFLGALLAVSLPILFVLAARALRFGRRGAAAYLGALAAAAGALLVATLSRAAWSAALAAVAALGAAWWAAGRRRAAGSLALAAGAVLLGVVGALSLSASPLAVELRAGAGLRLASLARLEGDPRADLWRAAGAIWAEHRWLGAGVDTFQLAYPRHESARAPAFEPERTPEHAHNAAAQTLATQGALGLAALALLVATLGWSFARAWTRTASLDERDLVAGAGAALAAFAVQAAFGFTVIPVGVLAVTCAAILSARAQGAGERAAPALQGDPRGLAAALGGASAIGVAAFALNAWAARAGPSLWIATGLLAASLGGAVLAAWRVEQAAGAHADRTDARDARERAPSPRAAAIAGGGVAVAAALALAAAVAEPFRADAFCRRGHVLLAAGRPAEAIPYLEEALRRAPRRDRFWTELGVAHHRAAFAPGTPEPARRAHLAEALRAHEKARSLVPASPLHAANRARVLADLARSASDAVAAREVRAAFETALTLAPRSALLLEDAAKAELFLGDPAAAAAYAQRSLADRPHHGAARALLAAAAMEEGNWSEAERSLEAAVAADWGGDLAGRAAAFANLSRVQREQGRLEEALASAERALEVAPGSGPGQRARARALEALGRSGEAAPRPGDGAIGERR